MATDTGCAKTCPDEVKDGLAKKFKLASCHSDSGGLPDHKCLAGCQDGDEPKDCKAMRVTMEAGCAKTCPPAVKGMLRKAMNCATVNGTANGGQVTTAATTQGAAGEAGKGEAAKKAMKGRAGAAIKAARASLAAMDCDGKGKKGAGAGRVRRANHSATKAGKAGPAVTCADLRVLLKSKGDAARATLKKLKDALGKCKPAGAGANATVTVPARTRRDNHVEDFTGFSCAELDAEITTLEAEASAAGLVLGDSAAEATTAAGATTAGGDGDDSGAGTVAAGVSAFVALAFAQLA